MKYETENNAKHEEHDVFLDIHKADVREGCIQRFQVYLLAMCF